MKYFHELTGDEFQALVDAGIRWNQLSEMYPQPEWCEYPNALDGLMGCWSLTGRLVTGEDFCQNCDLYQPRTLTNQCSGKPKQR